MLQVAEEKRLRVPLGSATCDTTTIWVKWLVYLVIIHYYKCSIGWKKMKPVLSHWYRLNSHCAKLSGVPTSDPGTDQVGVGWGESTTVSRWAASSRDPPLFEWHYCLIKWTFSTLAGTWASANCSVHFSSFVHEGCISPLFLFALFSHLYSPALLPISSPVNKARGFFNRSACFKRIEPHRADLLWWKGPLSARRWLIEDLHWLAGLWTTYGWRRQLFFEHRADLLKCIQGLLVIFCCFFSYEGCTRFDLIVSYLCTFMMGGKKKRHEKYTMWIFWGGKYTSVRKNYRILWQKYFSQKIK